MNKTNTPLHLLKEHASHDDDEMFTKMHDTLQANADEEKRAALGRLAIEIDDQSEPAENVPVGRQNVA